MAITLHTLASGSSGNALTLSSGGTRLLVDAGISCRRITAALASLGDTPGDLEAILITHTHWDHVSGLATLLKRTACPVMGSRDTVSYLSRKFPLFSGRFEALDMGCPRDLGAFRITAFPISHDEPGSCGFRLDDGECGAGILTDTGYVTPEAAEILPGVALAVLEANHDRELLRSGPYPYFLKERILDPQGHLSNEDAGSFAVTLAHSGAEQLILAHLSKENNTPELALRAVETALHGAGLDPAVSVAPRDTLSRAYTITGRAYAEGTASLRGEAEGEILSGRGGGVRQAAEPVL